MTPLMLAATLSFTVPTFDSPSGCVPDSAWPRMAPVSVQIEARGPRDAWAVLRWLVDMQGWPEDALWASVWPTVAAEAEPRIARTKHYPGRQPHEPAVRDTASVEGELFRVRVVKGNGLASCWSRSVSR